MVAAHALSHTAEPQACPFCLTPGVGLLANFHDSLAAYRCDRCRGVFYTIELQLTVPLRPGPPRPRVVAPPVMLPAPKPDHAARVVRPTGRLAFGRRLRRPGTAGD